jgi:hypothetical protein
MKENKCSLLKECYSEMLMAVNVSDSFVESVAYKRENNLLKNSS